MHLVEAPVAVTDSLRQVHIDAEATDGRRPQRPSPSTRGACAPFTLLRRDDDNPAARANADPSRTSSDSVVKNSTARLVVLGRRQRHDRPRPACAGFLDPRQSDLVHRHATAMVAAISGRGSRISPLSRDNLTLGAETQWSRAASRRPYVVTLANRNNRFGTVALDFDAKLGEPGDAAEEADLVVRLLVTAGMPYVLAHSGPSGGRHVFVPVAGVGLTLDAARALVERLRDLGLGTLDPSCMGSLHAAIRPPGSPHRIGGRSEVVGDRQVALDCLRRDRPDAPRAADWHEFIDALTGPHEMRVQLRRDDDTDLRVDEARTFRSGSELLQSYATRVVARGGGLPELESFVAALPADDDAVRHLMKKSPAGRAKALRRSIRKAERWRAENPAAYQGRVDDEAVIAAWRQYDWAAVEGPLGPAATVLLARAEEYGRRLVGVSTRALALVTAMSEPSARRGLTEAVQAGLLEMADGGRGARARRYRLNPVEMWDPALRDAVGPSPCKGGVRMPTASPSADPAIELARDVGAEVWCVEALGHKVRLVYLALAQLTHDGLPVSTATVSAQTGKKDRQVRKDLGLLARHGLARDLGRAGWVSEHRDPCEITDVLGVTGIVEKRRRKYSHEQRAHLLGIVEHRLRRKFRDAEAHHDDCSSSGADDAVTRFTPEHEHEGPATLPWAC